MVKNFISGICILVGLSVFVSSCEQNQGNSAPSNSSGVPSTPDNPPSPGGNTVPKDSPNITVDKTTLSPADGYNTARYTITNSGSAPFTIQRIDENNAKNQFTMINNLCPSGKNLDVSSTCTIDVKWQGATTGVYSFDLTTGDGTLKTSPTVTGTTPAGGGGFLITGGSQTPLQSGQKADFTLTNVGSSNLQILALTASNSSKDTGFFKLLNISNCPVNVNKGESCTVSITFSGAPQAQKIYGPFSFTVTTISDNIETSVTSDSVTGIVPVQPPVSVSYCPDTNNDSFPGSDWSYSIPGGVSAKGYKFQGASWDVASGKISCTYGKRSGSFIQILSAKSYQDSFVNFPTSTTSAWTAAQKNMSGVAIENCASEVLSQCPFTEAVSP